MLRSKSTVMITLLAVALALLVSACQGARAAQSSEVTFTARDYSYSGPDTIPAGWTQLRLENEGPSYHHIQLVKLPAGKTIEDLTAALNENLVAPEWVEHYGGPNPPDAGQSSAATVYLEPGHYAIISTIPGKDGQPQFVHGMVKAVTVSSFEEGRAAAEPRADIHLDMDDFTYSLSQQLTAGRHTIRVNNKGMHPHELFLARLAPGKGVDEFLASLAPDAPAGAVDWQALGGVSAIEPGTHAYFTADLKPGTYLLICFFPDTGEGLPHFAMGMAQVITIEQ